MSFNSITYLLFLPVVLGLYWLLPHRGQNAFLLAASMFFLGFVHPWFVGLISAVALIHFSAGILMERYPHRRLQVLFISLFLSLGILGFFKYANFFLENVAASLELFGLGGERRVLDILLPVGISFYTFQAISYTVDVYRGEVKPQKNIVDFCLFISFFPQLVAGPIERSRDLLPQVIEPRILHPEQFRHGMLLLLWGFFKKVVIADNCGLIAYKVFSLARPDFYLLWAGVYAFAIQILADFWSYTDIARGTALLFGFRLSRNFNHPYFSVSPAEFWRRWHMSLSYWLRDYVYIPLGGSRKGKWRARFNILLTFLLSGLWHGASWNFVIWGGYHGMLVIIQKILPARWFRYPDWLYLLVTAGKVLTTFLLVGVGWLIFRVTDLDRLRSLFLLSPFGVPSDSIQVAAYVFLLSFLYSLPIWLHGTGDLIYKSYLVGEKGTVTINRLLLLRPILMLVLFLGILTLRSPAPSTFIYFQF